MSDKYKNSPEELLAESFRAYGSLLKVAVFTVRELDRELGDLDITLEDARNKRQRAAEQFENFDQKANQLYNLLSSVMKAMAEMRMGIARNML